MALTATQKLSVNNVTASNAAPYTSSAFTPANNSLLVVTLSALSDSTPDLSTVLTSSPSLTWTRWVLERTTLGNYAAEITIWTAEVATGASTTITMTPRSGTSFMFSDGNASAISVTEFTGYDSVGGPTGVSGSDHLNTSSTGAHSLTLSGTSASDSAIVAVASLDGDHLDPASYLVEGSGYTVLYASQNANLGWHHSLTEYKIGAQSTAEWATLQTAYQFATGALEIKAAASADVLMAQIWL